MTIENREAGPADAAEARAITEQVRAAMEEHVRSGIELARAVRRAHSARVWIALGHETWEAYARAEFGVSRASAYRLLDMATVLDQLDAAAGALGLSPLGDTLTITRQEAREIKGRVPEVAAALAACSESRTPRRSGQRRRHVAGRRGGRRPARTEAARAHRTDRSHRH
jgi:hypothetical protein